MKNRRLITRGSLILLLFIGGGILIFFNDSLPPRTPHRAGRVISGLSIPGRSVVHLFKDEAGGFVGDVYTKIVFDLTEADFTDLEQESIRAGFKPYTKAAAKRLPPIGYPVTFNNSLYKLVRENKDRFNEDYAIVVLDRLKHQLIVVNVST